MEAIRPTKKMVVEAGKASFEAGGLIRKAAVGAKVALVVAPAEEGKVGAGVKEVRVSRTSEARHNNNINNKIQTSSLTSKFF